MKKAIFLAIFCTGICLLGQTYPKRVEKSTLDYWGGIYIGINGLKRVYYECGYSSSIYSNGSRFSKTVKIIDLGLIVGDFREKSPVFGTKIGFDIIDNSPTGLSPSLGVQLINYNNWKNNSVCIRPTVGIDGGLGILDFTYGYNFIIQNNGLVSPVLTKHCISIHFRIGTMVNYYNK